MMTEAAKQIVGRLQALGASDREWVLHQLTADERHQVLAVLSDRPTEALNVQTVQDVGSEQGPVANANMAEIPAEFARLDSATPRQVVTFLADQPDWIIVLLLGFREWSWTGGFLRLLPPQKLGALRQLSTELDGRVTGRVKEAVTRVMADRIRMHAEIGTRSVFDLALERAEQDGLANHAETGVPT